MVLSGSPHKARKEEAPDNPESLKNPLLQFDLKFDFLRDLLGNVTTVINQHASLLNKVQLDVGDKLDNIDVIPIFLMAFLLSPFQI